MGALGVSTSRRLPRVFSAASGGSAKLLGIEVTQAIQNLAHDVRLIAGKRTIVRVYIQPRRFNRNVRVRGEIAVSSAEGAPERYVTSRNIVSLREEGPPTLKAQRADAELSLNFELPPQGVGPLYVRLNRIIPVATGDDVPIAAGETARLVRFDAAAPLRVRAIGLRFRDGRVDPARDVAPNALHFDLLRSFLTRTYPVPGLEWSQIVVSAGNGIEPPFRTSLWTRVVTRLQQIRQADVNAGRDPRTHYYGIIADQGGQGDFLRGRASDIPVTADPAIVAFGPAGSTRFRWDRDGSYADWYGAHELGHTFGCRHPGFCGTPTQERDAKSSFPYPKGRISDADEDCVGFDVGDPALDLPMRALRHREHHDFMTYCENQWISRHTYDELFARIQAEDDRFAPPTV